MHDIIDNNQQKYNSTRLDVHKNTIQEIRNHIFKQGQRKACSIPSPKHLNW
jgi:hypothetical protein